jgi:N-acetylneuraminate synthase/sialic acid synthase
MAQMKIENRLIADSEDCYVIAEIGHNHQGKLETAKELFKVAKECGADAVKLQKRDNVSLYSRELYNKSYDNENSYGKTYGEHREFLEFGRDAYLELQRYAQELKITMFATAFDFKSADFLAELNMPAYKIASGDLKNTPLLKYVAKLGKPMIVSTGGAAMEDIQRAYDTILPFNTQLALLQCSASYPTPPEEMNLRVIQILRERFPNAVIGLSDHYDGIAVAPVAYMLGARIIEKHFTLHHSWKGTDHAFSLEPIGLKKMVRDLGRTRIALGDGVKRIYDDEKMPLVKMGKQLVAARDLEKGHTVLEKDIAVKSPGGGLPPYEIDKVIGRVLRQAVKEDQAFKFEDLG